jgi:gliding motility-associated lipoprotein GldD
MTRIIQKNIFMYGLFISFIGLVFSCEKAYTPKPKSYPRIEYPERSYQVYSPPSCPFSFEIPTYATVVHDSTFFSEKVENPCWINLVFKQFGGTIHVSYEDVQSKEQIAKLLDDAHTLTYKHTKKAESIDPIEVKNKYGVRGLIYDVGGNAASNIQFYVTDMDHHFLRGALYFNTAPNIDSMGPVVDFVKKDMDHLIETFQWK